MSQPATVVDVTSPEPITSAEVAVPERHVEYGLQLPNGEIQWGTALGHPINTEPERSVMVVVLHKTGTECGWAGIEDQFVSNFRWVPRTVIQEKGVSYALDNPSIAPPLPVSNEDATTRP